MSERLKVHIRDNCFFNNQYPTRANPYFDWIWDRQPKQSEITVFSDEFLREAKYSKSKIKIAWLVEPPAIHSATYAYAASNHNEFDYIFTFSENLLKIDPRKFKRYYYGTTWITGGAAKIYPKTKMTNLIASPKRFAEGHKIRHDAANRFRGKVDLMGRGYAAFDPKVEGLKNYRYSITAENCRHNWYFSEKLLDCFFTGTVPIYWGFPDAIKLFNPEGIITFNKVEDLDSIISFLSLGDYQKRLPAIKENFERAKSYTCFERYMWENCLKELHIA